MKLTVWTYEGPPHVGAMRVATGMTGLHYVLHAPQGDTYADLLFTMIERRSKRPPVTYTTFQARDLGADTADLFQTSCREAYARFQPQAMIVGASCTAELIQDDPGGLAERMDLPVPVVALELPSYQRKENFGASETFFQLVRNLAKPCERTAEVSCNIIGPTGLGFRHRDDVTEVTKLLSEMGVAVNLVAPMGSCPDDFARLGAAHFNVMLYPETAETAARWLEREFDQPYTKTVPMGVHATAEFVEEVATIAGVEPTVDEAELRMPWYSASVDSTYLTGKRVFIFGDATHAKAAARIARDEMGFEVVGLGCYNREFARDIAPVHVQDFPARYSPVMGFEGANVIFDTWVHPLVMGLEEHLLHMFREDFEFNDAAGPSHHGGLHKQEEPVVASAEIIWLEDAEKELKKVPFFVRGKARRNTEKFAATQGIASINVDTLYEAKAHYAR